MKTEVKVCLSFYIFSRIENEEDGRAGVIRSIEHSRRTMKYYRVCELTIDRIPWVSLAAFARWLSSLGRITALLVLIKREFAHAVVVKSKTPSSSNFPTSSFVL